MLLASTKDFLYTNKNSLFFFFTIVFYLTLFSPSFFYSSTLGILLLLFTLAAYPLECRNFIVENKKSFFLLIVSLFVGTVFSAIPEKSIKGSYDFLRGAFLVLPAYISSCLFRFDRLKFEKILALTAYLFHFLLGLLPFLYFYSGGARTFKAFICRFSDLHFGNVHNLINGVVLLFLLSLTSFLWNHLKERWTFFCFSVA